MARRLALTDMAAEPLEAIMSELPGGGSPVWGRAMLMPLTSRTSRPWWPRSTRLYGRVEVLVNVAGTFKMSDFADSKPPDWSEMISANLLTALVASRVRPTRHARGEVGRHCQFCLDSGRIWFYPAGGCLCGG